jgi:predicted ATPase
VLTDDPALVVRTVAALRAAGDSHRVLPAPLATPHQLPNPIKDFVGRAAELTTLDRLAREAGTTRYPAVVAICGGPGIGKSALAIHAAHRIARYFPDGELYIDLKGFGPQDCPVGPGEALQEILGALGIAPDQLPASVDARASFYRSVLANRKMLVVADNVFDSAQVRPLVPACPGCMMIVTSRRQIANMVTSVGAYLINLDVLSSRESQELLVSRSGSGATAGEAEAVARLADLCDGLPLALAVIAARAAARPGHTLSQMAAVMGQSASRLDVLNDFEPAGDVRTAFSWSYAKLTGVSARMFRLLSLHEGPEITVAAAADLAGVSITVANMALMELTQMHLVAERSPGRFYLPKLLRDYAAEMHEAEEAAADRNVA